MDLPASSAADPGVSAEIRPAVAMALGRLPPKRRIVVLLAFVEEQTYKDVAAALERFRCGSEGCAFFAPCACFEKTWKGQGFTP
jgi:hypothetical protein